MQFHLIEYLKCYFEKKAENTWKKMCQSSSRVWLSVTPWRSPRLCPWNYPGKNTGVRCDFLLQGSSSPRDQTCVSCISCISRQILQHLSPLGSPERKQHCLIIQVLFRLWADKGWRQSQPRMPMRACAGAFVKLLPHKLYCYLELL